MSTVAFWFIWRSAIHPSPRSKFRRVLRKLRYFGEYNRHIRASFPFVRDPTDAKLVELAIDGRATHIVTYDADLLSLPDLPNEASKRFRQRLRGVRVLRPEELIRQILDVFHER